MPTVNAGEVAATTVVNTLSGVASRVRTAVAEGHPKLTVAQRSEMMAAWAAAQTASRVALRWRDRISSEVDSKITMAVDRVSSDTEALFADPSDAAIQAHAVALYKDAIAVSQMFAVATARAGAPASPVVAADTCNFIY